MVQQISLIELDDRSVEVESAVDLTPSIDPWCSGPDWQIPVATAFASGAERLLLAGSGGEGFALLAKYRGRRGPMLGGMEPLWGFGAPIFGRDPTAVATELAATLCDRRDWRTLFLAGMPAVTGNGPDNEPAAGGPAAGTGGDDSIGRDSGNRDGSGDTKVGVGLESTVTMGIAFALSSLGQVGLAAGITRQVADLSHGYEAWLSRRAARFRRNLRQATAKAGRVGLEIEDASHDPSLFDRMMAVEHRSWKGREHSGITSNEMSTMYRTMIGRLARRNRLNAHIATIDGVDVGYILGGVRARRYRGLQLSYSDDARHLSVGNLLQDHQLRELDRHGLADVYDLGMDFDYKRRWADRAETSVTVVVHRR